MPKDSIVFFKDEIEARIAPKKPVNESGYVYVGREFKGKYVECIILKIKESNKLEECK